jgi:hypothetical protein
MIKLSENSLALLKSCLEKHNPTLIQIVESSGEDEYTVEFYNQLREIVGDELIARGFNQDYQPNPYGIELEKLIDEIGRLFLYRGQQ